LARSLPEDLDTQLTVGSADESPANVDSEHLNSQTQLAAAVVAAAAADVAGISTVEVGLAQSQWVAVDSCTLEHLESHFLA
jgi:hypothetical protein